MTTNKLMNALPKYRVHGFGYLTFSMRQKLKRLGFTLENTEIKSTSRFDRYEEGDFGKPGTAEPKEQQHKHSGDRAYSFSEVDANIEKLKVDISGFRAKHLVPSKAIIGHKGEYDTWEEFRVAEPTEKCPVSPIVKDCE